MNALYTLILFALLTGCSSNIFSLKPEQKVSSDMPQTKVITKASVDNSNAGKVKILIPEHVDTLPPLSKSGFAEGINTLSTTSMTDPKKPIDSVSHFSAETLKVGSTGDAVRQLEKQLDDLHYDVGIVDGFYDQETRQGVMAFQKYNRLQRTGTYTLETQDALQVAMSPEGVHPELGLPRVEVDITRQVLLFFDGQGLNRVIPVSSGSDRKYCEISKKTGKRVCGVATTPRGQFSVQWRVSGWRESDLGKLYNPLYFNGGYAIHGSPSVPDHNVSHGCVRIPIATAIWFYEAIQDGTPVIVFD